MVRLTEWPTVKWNSLPGKITLAGDAAHPMTFRRSSFLVSRVTHYAGPSCLPKRLFTDRGQGLSNAIADATKLCKALQDHVYAGMPIEKVLAAYESEVVVRGRNAVISSTENSMLVTDWARVRESALF